jgi:CRP-like cAMP-binding protein
MERHPHISINALRVMVMRNQQRQQRYQELLTERVEQRLAQGLLRLADQVGKPEGDSIRIDLPLTRTDLAEYTGTTLYSVSRILRRWEEEGIVRSGRERVSLSDLPALQAIANDTSPP